MSAAPTIVAASSRENAGLPSARARQIQALLFAEAGEVDHAGGFPRRSMGALHDAGLLAATLPRELGGEGLGGRSRVRELLLTLTSVGRGSLVVGRIFEGHVNALQLVWRYGSPALQRRAADDVLAGHLFGVWNTEAADGLQFSAAGGNGSSSAVASIRLHGAKTFASGLGHVTRAVVTGRDLRAGADSRSRMVVIPTDTQPPYADTTFWKPLGMRSTASHRANLAGIVIDTDSCLGELGDYYRQPAFGAGAIRFVAVQQGGIEALFDETRRFLRRGGRTDDPHQRSRIGEMASLVESGRLWIDGMARHAAGAMPQDEPGVVESVSDDRAAASAVAYANVARTAIEAIGTRVILLADRAVGARGLLQPEPFERLHRDLAHYLRQPAPDAALADAGRHVLESDADASALW